MWIESVSPADATGELKALPGFESTCRPQLAVPSESDSETHS